MRFQVLPIDVLPLFPGLHLGAIHLYLRVGLYTARGSVLKVEMTILDNQTKGISIDE